MYEYIFILEESMISLMISKGNATLPIKAGEEVMILDNLYLCSRIRWMFNDNSAKCVIYLSGPHKTTK